MLVAEGLTTGEEHHHQGGDIGAPPSASPAVGHVVVHIHEAAVGAIATVGPAPDLTVGPVVAAIVAEVAVVPAAVLPPEGEHTPDHLSPNIPL